MVFILYKLYFLFSVFLNLPLTGNFVHFYFLKKNLTLLFINLLKNGDMGKCPHKSPSPCNTCHTHVFIQICVLICHKNTHTRVHARTLTHSHTHARTRAFTHTHTHTHRVIFQSHADRRSWISRSQTLQSELSQRVKVNLYFKSAVYCLLRTKSVVSVTSVQLANSVTDRNQKVSDDVLLLHSSMSL